LEQKILRGFSVSNAVPQCLQFLDNTGGATFCDSNFVFRYLSLVLSRFATSRHFLLQYTMRGSP
jgi:hypothetical protein